MTDAADLTHLEVVLTRRQLLKAQIKAAEEELEVLEPQIREAWGDAPEATVNGQPLGTWKPGETTVLDQSLLKAAYPEVWKACRVTKPTRPLRITWEPPEWSVVTKADRLGSPASVMPEDDF